MSPEHRLQSRIRMYLDAGLPEPGTWTSIDKGLLLSGTPEQRMHQAMKLKARGIRSGVSDLVVLYHGRSIWIELKVGRNRLADHQITWADAVRVNGFHAEEARSVVEVHDLLIRLGVPVAPAMRIAAMNHDAALSIPEPPKKRAPARATSAKPSAKALAFGRAAVGVR